MLPIKLEKSKELDKIMTATPKFSGPSILAYQNVASIDSSANPTFSKKNPKQTVHKDSIRIILRSSGKGISKSFFIFEVSSSLHGTAGKASVVFLQTETSVRIEL
jgi:hypothetical protein